MKISTDVGRMNDRMNEDSLLIQCKTCGHNVSKLELAKTLFVCQACGCHMKISARQRIEFVADAGSFHEINAHMGFVDPIAFPQYEEKYLSSRQKTGIDEAIVTGMAAIEGRKVALGVMESDFIMGSMGVTLGEKVCLLFEQGMRTGCPVVLFTASGGARMQEGVAALMQMSKTASVVGQLNEQGIPFISVLTHPTTGGVTASFAMLGDIILAEPDALIGFAGPRVIQQTIKKELPMGFQKSEHLLQCGFVDKIVQRSEIRDVLRFLIDVHTYAQAKNRTLMRVMNLDPARENVV
jgi:acetyl-CoA carboxylase carboxyl transferase subunit beta